MWAGLSYVMLHMINVNIFALIVYFQSAPTIVDLLYTKFVSTASQHVLTTAIDTYKVDVLTYNSVTVCT